MVRRKKRTPVPKTTGRAAQLETGVLPGQIFLICPTCSAPMKVALVFGDENQVVNGNNNVTVKVTTNR